MGGRAARVLSPRSNRHKTDDAEVGNGLDGPVYGSYHFARVSVDFLTQIFSQCWVTAFANGVAIRAVYYVVSVVRAGLGRSATTLQQKHIMKMMMMMQCRIEFHTQ